MIHRTGLPADFDERQELLEYLDERYGVWQEANPKGKKLDLDKYTRRTEWGQHVEEYMEEMRGNDRL